MIRSILRHREGIAAVRRLEREAADTPSHIIFAGAHLRTRVELTLHREVAEVELAEAEALFKQFKLRPIDVRRMAQSPISRKLGREASLILGHMGVPFTGDPIMDQPYFGMDRQGMRARLVEILGEARRYPGTNKESRTKLAEALINARMASFGR